MYIEKALGCKHFHERPVIILAVVLCLILSLVPSVSAHKVYLFVWVEGDTAYTESYFSGGKKVMGGPIKVYDMSGNKLLEGKTNDKGEFSFKIPQKTDLRVVLEATMGHKTEYVLKADEIPDIVRSDATNKTTGLPGPSPAAIQMASEQISMVVEKALDSRLKPIIKTLAKIQEERGPGFTEIIGGVGYIFGLMGLILYFKSRRKQLIE